MDARNLDQIIIVACTSGTTRDGKPVQYQLGRAPGKRFVATRQVETAPGRYERDHRPGLSQKQAFEAIRAFKALDRGDHAAC
jgi:hypothetical protein